MATAGEVSKPVFATAAYAADDSGVFRVVLPARCVRARTGPACQVYVDHYRPRKTGPGYAVAVVGCRTHAEGRYTLYPPGHYRYGREAVVACAPTGELLRSVQDGGPRWSATLFAAGLEAVAGPSWPAGSPADDPRRRRTQGRRLALAGALLGVGLGVTSRCRERIATRLGVATMTLRAAAADWAVSWARRGRAIAAVLKALPVDARLLDRVLSAATVVAGWSAPQRWDGGRRGWVRGRSLGPERAVAPGSDERAPLATTLPAARSDGVL